MLRITKDQMEEQDNINAEALKCGGENMLTSIHKLLFKINKQKVYRK